MHNCICDCNCLKLHQLTNACFFMLTCSTISSDNILNLVCVFNVAANFDLLDAVNQQTLNRQLEKKKKLGLFAQGFSED